MIARTPRLNSDGLLSGTQIVIEHCYNVAKTAYAMGRNQKESNILFTLGLVHDIGKYHREFQNKIRGLNPEPFSHPSYSLKTYMENFVIYDDVLGCMIINGHHIGLDNMKDFVGAIIPILNNKSNEYINKLFINDLKCLNISPTKMQAFPSTEYRKNYSKQQLKDLEMKVRYFFSTIVDADHTDAERVSDYKKHLLRGEIQYNIDDLINSYNDYNSKFLHKDFFGIKVRSKESKSILNTLRRDIRDRVIERAKDMVPFGVIDVLTGLGKTNTMIGYGLNYLKYHSDKKRIIFVVPYISIITQFEEVFNKILGRDDLILSHHSNESIKESDPFYHEKMSAVENYFGYPIIITTYVQFFDTIFSNKAGKVKKLHNMADSIILFDEFHTIPLTMTQVFLEGLKNMNRVMNCDFVFSSATIPNLNKRYNYESGLENVIKLYDKSDSVFNTIDRVDYKLMGDIKNGSMEEVTITDLRNDIDSSLSNLFIVNTKRDAYRLYLGLKDLPFDKVYFLSGWRTKHDNQGTINEIKKSLHNKDVILVVSTQIIEAGVDVDFPIIYRHIAPMEALLQTAGRCNREFNKRKGIIKIFMLCGSKMPMGSQYKTGTNATISFLENNPNILYEYDGFSKYYNFFTKNGYHTDKLDINGMRENFAYKDVAENVYTIDTESIGVVIPNEKTLKVLEGKKWLNREDRKKLAPYEIAIFPHEAKRMEVAGVIKKLPCGSILYNSLYEDITGISSVMCPEEYIDSEDFIV